MLIPLLTLFFLASIVWLAIGVKGRKETALLAFLLVFEPAPLKYRYT